MEQPMNVNAHTRGAGTEDHLEPGWPKEGHYGVTMSLYVHLLICFCAIHLRYYCDNKSHVLLA